MEVVHDWVGLKVDGQVVKLCHHLPSSSVPNGLNVINEVYYGYCYWTVVEKGSWSDPIGVPPATVGL